MRTLNLNFTILKTIEYSFLNTFIIELNPYLLNSAVPLKIILQKIRTLTALAISIDKLLPLCLMSF